MIDYKNLTLFIKNNIYFLIIVIILICIVLKLIYSNSKTNNQNDKISEQNNNKIKRLNILHIGKTAGRAINDSIKNEPYVKLARHPILGKDLANCNCDIAAVIRDPKDRLVSAISWFRQGGEKGEMFKHPCHNFVKNKKISEILSNPNEFQQRCLFNRNTAFIPTTHYLKQIEDTVIPICYNNLQGERNN